MSVWPCVCACVCTCADIFSPSSVQTEVSLEGWIRTSPAHAALASWRPAARHRRCNGTRQLAVRPHISSFVWKERLTVRPRDQPNVRSSGQTSLPADSACGSCDCSLYYSESTHAILRQADLDDCIETLNQKQMNMKLADIAC